MKNRAHTPSPRQLAAELQTLSSLLTIEDRRPHLARHLQEAAQVFLQTVVVDGKPPQRHFGPETQNVLTQLQTSGLQDTARKLGISLPLSIVELLSLPGVGPKTAHSLYQQWGITSVAALAAALTHGSLNKLPGFGVARLQRLQRDTAVLLERQHKLPIARAWPAARTWADRLLACPGVTKTAVTGEARRLETMVSSIEIAVEVEDFAAFRAWATETGGTWRGEMCIFPQAIPGESIDLRIHPAGPEEFALVLMQTTGDETHVGVVKGMLETKGLTWSDGGIRTAAGIPVPIESEADIYKLIELPCYPPELRSGRGILQMPDKLIKRRHIMGDLHVHSNWSDGSQTIPEIAEHAARLGYAYVAITDHSQSLTIAHGLSPEALTRQRADIEAARSRTNIHILHGIEVDILADGTLDLPDETLFDLDIVIASVHSAMHQSPAQMTKRLCKAASHPAVDILGHPTGRMIGRRAGYPFDVDAVFEAAAANGTAVELNANPNRLDLSDSLLRDAVAAGLPIAIDTDAHHPGEFDFMAYGIRMATRGWLQPSQVLNTLPFSELNGRLHRARHPK